MWDLLLNPYTGIVYIYALAMHCSSIIYVLFEIKVVKCKLCESTSKFGGMKMLPRALCSSTHFAFVVIRMGVDDDPSLFENGTVAWLLFCLGMCNAISMIFGVGKHPTSRQILWARLRKYSCCLGLIGRHHPHEGRHPVSAMPGGLTGCSSFIGMPQSMMFFISGL